MVKSKQPFVLQEDGSVDVQAWIAKMAEVYPLKHTDTLQRAILLAQQLTHGMTTFYGKPRLEHGLEIAEILLALNLDQQSAAAGLVYGAVEITHPREELIHQTLDENVSKLISGVRKVDMISLLQKQQTGKADQMDKIRKMLLAMATDIRVVIIKLAERLCFMRGIKSIPIDERKHFAQEIQDIYAPLANRLGIGQIKWELEDLAFRYLKPDTYKMIASFIAEKRVDREKRIRNIIEKIKNKLDDQHIKASVSGRAKHIYSIYAKMKRKDVPQENIFDYSAVRILVPTIEDCYKSLSIVHHLWHPVMDEFDDYVASPKPNGYRSIHTAVIGEDQKLFEIQIRTDAMHDESERGIAAHWLYKENKQSGAQDKDKITYLRQLIDWHQEVSRDPHETSVQSTILEDQVYVVTPNGDIIDLPLGATPIDFAYHIHTEVGHRCRGAKINGHIVPLTYTLQTGDCVEVNTISEGYPSRDWLNAELGFVKTSRAKSKIMHWFNQQDCLEDISHGRESLEKELSRHGLSKTTSLQTIARSFHFKKEDDLLAAIGRGHIKPTQIIHSLQPRLSEKTVNTSAMGTNKESPPTSTSHAFVGANDLLTRIAQCCKPIPGDPIFGYITQGRGISIHKKNCTNASNLTNPKRFVDITWDKNKSNTFVTDLKILAQDNQKTLHDINTLFVNEKIPLLGFRSKSNRHQNKLIIIATIHIQNMTQLQHLAQLIQQLPGVIDVARMRK